MHGKRAKAEALYNVGQPVIVTRSGEELRATIYKFKKNGLVRVALEAGGKINVDKKELRARVCLTEGCGRSPDPMYEYCDICLGTHAVDAESVSDEDTDPELKGGKEMSFVQYEVEWKKRKKGKKPRQFTVDVKEHKLHCYGWWRKTRVANNDQLIYAIDLFVKRAGHDYTIEPVYYNENPLKNYKSLNADICAALNKFLHQTLNGRAENLETLQAKSRFPIVKISRLRTIDSLILGLREIRDTAIRAGGVRLFELKGDNAETPTVRIYLDLTTQAMGLRGKAPSLETGAIFDSAPKGERSRKLSLTPQKTNVEDLAKELKKAKEEGNVALARKIRAIMRRMGHHGGARALNKKKEK